MASARNSATDHEAMLRRVAIVLSSLPAPVASRLLGAVAPEQKLLLRRAMTTLSDVDPLERHRALQAFKVSVQQQPAHAATADADQFVNQSAGGDNVATRAGGPAVLKNASRQPVQPDTPLAFLGDVDDETLVRLLSDEHPQAVALVLASIAPAQSARILPQLDAGLRIDALTRLGRLGEVPEAAASEVAQHFRQRLERHATSHRHAAGKRALDAILAAMPVKQPSAADDSNGQRSAATAANGSRSGTDAFGPTDPSAALAAAVAAPGDSRRRDDVAPVDRNHSDRDHSGRDHSDRDRPSRDPQPSPSGPYRVAEHTWPDATSAASQPRSDRAAVTSTPPAAHRGDDDASGDASDSNFGGILGSSDAIQRHLIDLRPLELCDALGRVSTRDAMLTLAGLPTRVTEAALGVLPRSQAKQVRSQLHSLDSVQLREIDQAKHKVARASLEVVGKTRADQAAKQVPVAA